MWLVSTIEENGMFYTQGLAANVETIAYLSATKHYPANGHLTLRQAYKHFLKLLQHQDYQMPGHEVICHDQEKIEPVIRMFTDRSLLSDLTTDVLPTPLTSSLEAMRVVEQALSIMQASSAELAELFHLAIHTMFYARSSHSGGGSVSTAIGVIWCSHRRDWSLLDVMEFLVHELTHSLVSLDELRHQYFYSSDAIALPQNFARSAILNKARPLDKTLHSIVVGYEILALRQHLRYELRSPKAHPVSVTLRRQVIESIDDVESLPNLEELATPRVRRILTAIRERLSSEKEGAVSWAHG